MLYKAKVTEVFLKIWVQETGKGKVEKFIFQACVSKGSSIFQTAY